MSEESSNPITGGEQPNPEASYAIVNLDVQTSDNTVIEYIVIPLAIVVFIGLVIFLIKKFRQPSEPNSEQAKDPEKQALADEQEEEDAQDPAEPAAAAAEEEKKEEEAKADDDKKAADES